MARLAERQAQRLQSLKRSERPPKLTLPRALQSTAPTRATLLAAATKAVNAGLVAAACAAKAIAYHRPVQERSLVGGAGQIQPGDAFRADRHRRKYIAG